MSWWPLDGGAVRDRPTDQNFRGLARRGGELQAAALTKKEAKELFPQLVTLGSVKLSFGSITFEWPGGAANSKVLELEHKLGVEPQHIWLTGTSNGEFAAFGFQESLAGTVKAKVVAVAVAVSPAAGKKMTFKWTAIG